VQNAFLTSEVHLKNGSIEVSAAAKRYAVEFSAQVAQAALRLLAVTVTCTDAFESVERSFLTRCADLEQSSANAAMLAPTVGRYAVE
jgi:hypothetical protein